MKEATVVEVYSTRPRIATRLLKLLGQFSTLEFRRESVTRAVFSGCNPSLAHSPANQSFCSGLSPLSRQRRPSLNARRLRLAQLRYRLRSNCAGSTAEKALAQGVVVEANGHRLFQSVTVKAKLLIDDDATGDSPTGCPRWEIQTRRTM